MKLPEILLSGLVAFVGTGITVNWLVQRWQYRNWLNQQRFLGAEKRYEALRIHAEDVSRLSASRLSAMFRLFFSLSQSQEKIEERRKIYSDSVDQWNSNINSFYVKTAMYSFYGMTRRLEDDINSKFVSIGSKLEKEVRDKLAGGRISGTKVSILDELYKLQGTLGEFNRDMLGIVLKRQAMTYSGVRIKYREKNLEHFTTWQLFKALFISRVDDFSVLFTAFELELPAVRDD